MKDDNFLKANNAKPLWHPMGHPKDSLESHPRIITKAQGVKITDIDGHQTVDAVGGLWCVNLGYSNQEIELFIELMVLEVKDWNRWKKLDEESKKFYNGISKEL